ncbi:pimeloyl-ACP methyl ester esterase BioH [Dyella sp. C9]|uniref:pimeloyl-ACP methyl ester esterase BioH n=1 Tax=Dyella sp. C9 TaxID=2202154 RepID=UPI000DEF1AEF|nr:pimeloyl-ACP methyl ester esterase BioH [Dyella sp. C9]
MSLHIETHGHGEIPVVILHGWAMHGGMMEPLCDVLADRCTMHVVDLPGHGYSRDSTLSLEPSACAQAIAERTPAAIWIGWSLGGLIAMTGALEHPQQVRGLGVIDGTPKFSRSDDWPHGSDPKLVRQLAEDLETDYHGTLERFIALEAMGSRDPMAEVRHLRSLIFTRGEPNLRVLQEGIRILETSDRRADLAGLGVPSAWIAGHRDRIVPPPAMAWSAGQSRGDYVEIAHAGHAPFFGYANDVAAALAPLLDSFQ